MRGALLFLNQYEKCEEEEDLVIINYYGRFDQLRAADVIPDQSNGNNISSFILILEEKSFFWWHQ